MLRGKDFVEMKPLKGICHNKMYTVVGYTINQINWYDNGAYGGTRCVKEDYYVQEEDGKLIVNTVYKEGNQYVPLNRQKCTLSKDIEEIKVSLV